LLVSEPKPFHTKAEEHFGFKEISWKTRSIKIGVGDRGNMHWAMIRELGTVPEKSGSWAPFRKNRGTGIMDKRTGHRSGKIGEQVFPTGDRELSEPERVMY